LSRCAQPVDKKDELVFKGFGTEEYRLSGYAHAVELRRSIEEG